MQMFEIAFNLCGKVKGVKGRLFGQTQGIDSRARFEPEHPLFIARKGRGQGNRKKLSKQRLSDECR